MLYPFVILSLSAVLLADDQRFKSPVDLNTKRAFPKVESKEAWMERAAEMREHTRAVCGLLPMPLKMPLKARIFDRLERDGYSVEKVALETHPGFYLAGNLYRPLNQGSGPFPGVLNPHGHWSNGRFAETELGSIAARCINFAKQGMVAFSYDMVGYNDTRQIDHKFASHITNQLWNISLMGLQTWNSIRALDFLESLPDVDAKRLACTGESGGGTQTFILGAIDGRLKAQGPIVMVSHSMQGGCLCENAPGLRIEYSNMELAAVAAPRPQIIVAASGDWTRETMSVEGPSIMKVYQLFGAADRFRYALLDYEHNYNKPTREAVYAFFNHWLLNGPERLSLPEQPYRKESETDLRVFPDELPKNALNEQQLISYLVSQYKAQLLQALPYDADSLKQWTDLTRRMWKTSLHVEMPKKENLTSRDESLHTEKSVVTTNGRREEKNVQKRTLILGRKDKGDAIPVSYIASGKPKTIALLLSTEGRRQYQEEDQLKGLARELFAEGIGVVTADLFMIGKNRKDGMTERRDYGKNYFTTYNKTDIQERVQDLATIVGWIKTHHPDGKVVLVGEGRAGLWAMVAAPLVNGVIADGNQFDEASDAAVLERDLFFPGFRRVGGMSTIVALAQPGPLLLHNLHPAFDSRTLEAVYSQAKAGANLQLKQEKLPQGEVVAYLRKL